MTRTRLSTKGQLILPKEIRERLAWRPGTVLEVEDVDGTVIVRLAEEVPEVGLDELVGCAGYRGPRRSLADMEAAIAEGARRSTT